MRTRTAALVLCAAVSILGVFAAGIASPAAADDRVVVVQPGDTLGGIAVRIGVPVEVLAAVNGLADPDRITVGQRLRLEPVAATPAPTAASTTHRVRPGETLSDIALRYGTTVAELVRLNGIGDPSYIQAGELLSVPTGSAPSAGTPTSSVPASMAAAMARHEAIRRIIVAEATSQGVPASLALALAWQESGWQERLVSASGAVGVMQLLPSTAQWVAAGILHEPVDVTASRDNVRAGVALLGFYLDRYGGNRTLALAAYYQGMTATDRHGVYASSRPYVDAILALERRFRG